jgi:hypothetical protein
MTNFGELPETFDPSVHEGTGFTTFPPGWYQAHIVETSIEDAKNGNGTYLLAVFEVLNGEHKGRRIYQNVTLQNASQQAVEIGQRLLKDIYDSVGITGPTRDIQVMLFKPVMARVGIKVDRDGVYPDRNCVTSVRSPDYEPLRRGRNASAAAAGASRAAPAGATPSGAVSPPLGAVPPPSGPVTAAGTSTSQGTTPWRK